MTSPRRSQWPLILVSCSLVLLSATIFIKATRASMRGSDDDLYRQAELITQVLQRVNDDYVLEPDTWDLVYTGLEAMVSKLDPYCRFIPPAEQQRFEEETSGNYAGIGMLIHTTGPPVTVLYSFPGSPSMEAGLRPGDRIVAADGQSTETLGVKGTQKIIKGHPDSPVALTVLKADTGKEETLTVVRRRIEQPSVFGARVIDSQAGIGYVRIGAFQDATDKEFCRAMDQKLLAAGVQSLILDLRMDAGGLLDSAVTIANRFIPEGTLVRLEGRPPHRPSIREASPSRCHYPDMDLVVLIDRYTASAAEVLAGALQDYKRGLLVGTRSYGKGVVQSVVPLRGENDQELTLKLTTAHYVTPAGQMIERSIGLHADRRGGLEPDFQVPLAKEDDARKLAQLFAQQEIPDAFRSAVLELTGEAPVELEDPQLTAAIALLRGEPVLRSVPTAKAKTEAGAAKVETKTGDADDSGH